ncbi:MAG: hypothetical protein DRI57_10365 [Deltaproteobacteria bacterium]|nr:MAG: hypothetical protein DRI57_10365 [Deltaproteobacteria bacterium]
MRDIKMPKMDGIKLIGKIKEEGIDTSLIILTGHGGEEEAISALNLGVDAWFGKSGIEMKKLLDKVKELSEGVPLDEIRRLLSVIPDEVCCDWQKLLMPQIRTICKMTRW